MKFKIYDYNDKTTEVDTGDKEIKGLFVQVLSGDEVVTVEYDDGTKETFDSSDNRRVSYVEESYFVEKDSIQDWISYVSDDTNTNDVPHKRAWKFNDWLS
jgi:hypothetical protein|nr:MAG TPA: hypothetical protein [Caudoviricetes sp.]